LGLREGKAGLCCPLRFLVLRTNVIAMIMNPAFPQVLLVEDNEDDALLIKIAFERAGIDCPVQALTNGEEAIAYLSGDGVYQDRERYPLPTALLVDLKLPGKSGHEVLAWVRRQKPLDSLIRVVLTGSDRPEDVEKSYRLGAHGYLLKPLSPEQLTQPGINLRMILMGRRVIAPSRAAA